jgi:hydrogenase maturation protease
MHRTSMHGAWEPQFEQARTVRSAASQPRVLVIGLGNPILGDDGVGWSVARCVAERAGNNAQVEVDCLAVGGLSLMERMIGYRHVVLIDSIETGQLPIGTISVMELGELADPDLGHSASAHDASLITALATGQAMGAEVPERVEIVAIEARVGLNFTETLSAPVAAAVAPACEKVQELIDG